MNGLLFFGWFYRNGDIREIPILPSGKGPVSTLTKSSTNPHTAKPHILLNPQVGFAGNRPRLLTNSTEKFRLNCLRKRLKSVLLHEFKTNKRF